MEINMPLLSFSSGELSPKVWARTDRPFYQSGEEVCLNFIPQVTGPAKFRPGTMFVNHTRLNQKAVLIPFQFNDEQAYVLEFTNFKLRILKDGGNALETGVSITDITAASSGVVTAPNHGYNNGDEVYFSGIVGMTELNGQFALVANSGVNSFCITDVDGTYFDTSGYTAYASGGEVARVYELASPYAEADLFELKYAQTADVMYIVHPDYAPYKLTRTGHTSWTLTTYSRTSDPFTGAGDYPGAVGFYGGRLWMGGTDNNPDSIYGSRGPDTSTGAPQYDDFTVGTAANDGLRFTITSQNNTADRIRWFVGNPKFLTIGTFGGVYKANGGSDGVAITPTNISVSPADDYGCENINPLFGGGQIVFLERGGLTLRSFEYDWYLDDFTAYDRTLLADEITVGGIAQLGYAQGRPDIVWGVRSDGVLLSCTILSREDVAAWARHKLGGSGAVLSVCGEPRPSNVDRTWMVVERTIGGLTRRYLEYFSDDPVLPDLVDYYTGDQTSDEAVWRNIFYEQQKTFVRLDSALVYDGTKGTTLTLSAKTGTGVTATAGTATFEPDHIGRFIRVKFADGDETGIAQITGYTSSTVVTVKVLQDFDGTSYAANGWCLSANRLGGLRHLNGAEIYATLDGMAVASPLEVTDGYVDLPAHACYAVLGYDYTGILRTMAIEPGAPDGASQGREKTANKLMMHFRDTLGVKYGCIAPGFYSVSDIAYRRDGVDFYDRPPQLFTGPRLLDLTNKTSLDKRITIVQDQPYPCTIMSIVPFIDIRAGE